VLGVLVINDKELTHYFYDRPLESTERSLLVNRTHPLQRLDEAIAGAEEGQPENFAILGEEGMGKTSLSEITYANAKSIPTILPIHLEITSETTEYLFAKELCRQIIGSIKLGFFDKMRYLISKKENTERLLQEVNEAVRGIDSTQTDSDNYSFGILNMIQLSAAQETTKTQNAPTDISQMIGIIESITPLLTHKYKTIMVFIDEGRYIATEQSVALLQRLRLFFQRRPFMVIIAGSPMLIDELTKVVPEIANMFPEENRLLLKPLEVRDVAQLVERRMPKKNLLAKSELISLIARESEGNPRYVVRICRESIRIMTEENAKDITESMIGTASNRILAKKGRDIFNKLSEAQKDCVVLLHNLGGKSYATEMEQYATITRSRIAQLLSEICALGYAKSERAENKVLYFPNRALHQYLLQTFGEPVPPKQLQK